MATGSSGVFSVGSAETRSGSTSSLESMRRVRAAAFTRSI